MTRNSYQVLRKPLITEKGLDVKERNRTLVFRVAREANKSEIRAAVKAIFKIEVESVHTAVFLGKTRRRGQTSGARPDWKKAYVKLKAGQKIPEYAENV